MRIGSIGEASICRQYRSLAPVQGLQRRGHQILLLESLAPDDLTGSHDPSQLATCDVILGYRLLYGNVKAVQHCIDRGVAFVWDTDDDLQKLPRESPAYKALGSVGVRRLFAQTVRLARMADVVTTTTDALAEKYEGLGARRVEVIANYLADGPISGYRAPGDTFTIGWVAGNEHAADLQRVPFVKALKKILLAHPNVRVESAGVKLPLPPDRYRHYTWVPIDRLQGVQSRWDVGIAPLSNIPFNRARSDVKLKEYAKAGLPWLASPVGAYLDKGEEQGGQLVGNEEWFDALERLIEDPDLHRRLGQNAVAWAETQKVDRVADRWEQVCLEAVERRRARGSVPA